MATYSDSYDRADSTSLGSPWVDIVGAWGVISNGAYCSAAGDAFAAYNNTVGNNQRSKCIWRSNTSQVGPGVRMSSASTYTGYNFYVGSNGDGWSVQRAPGFTTIMSGSDTINDTDELELWADGTTITAYLNSVSIGSTTDANIASGQVGIIAYAFFVETFPFLASWDGGDISSGGTTHDKTASSTLAVTDAIARAVQRPRLVADIVTVTDAALRRVLRFRLSSDSAVVTDAALRTVRRARVASSTTTLSDVILRAVLRGRVTSDTSTVTDGSFRSVQYTKTVSDAAAVADGSFRSVRYTRMVTDAATVIDGFIKAISGAGTLYTILATDTVTITDFVFRAVQYSRAALDAVSVTDDSLHSTLRHRLATDTLLATSALSRHLTLLRTAFSSVTLTDGTLRAVLNVRTLVDALGVSDDLTAEYQPYVEFSVPVRPVLGVRVETVLGGYNSSILGAAEQITLGGYQ